LNSYFIGKTVLIIFKFTEYSEILLTIMSSTSVKHREFVSEPIGEKEVTAIAGIGPVYGQKLIDKGFDKAYTILGQYLLLKRDNELFVEWLTDLIGMSSKHAQSCYECIHDWSEQHL
ncbi:Barrier-to-autointegration factor 1, partial [Trichinella papuae]